MEVVQFREEVPLKDLLHELLDGADNAMQVDCADRRVDFEVLGWFVFPPGSLGKNRVSSAS